MMINRRQLLIRQALTVGSLPLRSLVTGLPMSFLARGAMAEGDAAGKFLILSHQSAGDPLNANAPGTYASDPNDDADVLNAIDHPTVAELGDAAIGYQTPSRFMLGDQEVTAAAPWASLPDDLRSQLAFWNHATFANAHPDFRSVSGFNGALKGAEGIGGSELAAMIAQENYGRLGTVTKDVMSVGGSSVSSNGQSVPILKPTSLQSLFGTAVGSVEAMLTLRDKFIDRAYRQMSQEGTAAQKAFFDRFAISRAEAKDIGENLGALLSDINGNDANNQAQAAVALLQLGIAPVVTLGIPFGGDNHNDSLLEDEVAQTDAAMVTLTLLWERLKLAGLEQRTVFASLNTFGRTLLRNSNNGRNHNGGHHSMVVMGGGIKAGIIGGMQPTYKNSVISDFKATAINPLTGAPAQDDSSGAIAYRETFSAVGKTLAKAVGIEDARINVRVDGGQVIEGALS